nr:MAG TPA: MAEBL protein [Caudoviricetes sp.]
MGKYDTILFGESGTEKPQFKSKYDNILFGDTTQPAEVPAGEVVSETQENTEGPLAGLPQQETKRDYKSYLGDYGVSADYGNNITYSDLNKRMEADKVDTNARREIQQEWFKGYQKYIDRLPEGDEKKAHQEHLKELSELPTTYLENTVGSAIAEGAKRGIVGTEAAVEGVKNLATSYVDLTDEELLAKYDPVLLEQIKKAGGVDQLRQIGMATKLQDEDLSGMGTTALHGATQEQRELGTKMLNALSDARSRDTLARTDKEGEEVVMDDGRVVKMSNLQAADYYNKARSRIAGEDEAAKEFNEDVLKSLSTANGWKHLLNAGARSSAQNVPTLLAGTAVSFVAPPVGIAIMQTGNISDQQLQGIQDLADKEYKKQHGEDTEVTSLSSAEYLNFLDKLAEEGKVSEQAADSFKTGFAMTLAEQVTGGVVGKLGSALSGMTAKTLAGKLAATSGAVGIHLTDEGWQEVASQVVENVRNDKPWNEGLAQAFTQGVFSIEGVLQQGAKGVGKLKELKGKDKEAVEKATEQNLAETAEQVAETKAEETPAEQTEPQAEPTADDINTQLEEAREQQEPDFDPLHTRESLMAEYDAITRAIGNGEPTPEQSQRLADIESEFTTQTKNEKGQTVTRNEFAKAYREWQTGTGEFATTQDTVNESRTDNRDGSQDVNGQPIEQGAVVSDTSTTEHSGQTSEPVSPVETKTTTTGYSESNTGTTANPVEQPNNNTPESDPVGLDGRTGETVGGRREQGELGQERSQQGNQSSQETVSGSTDSGVRERTKSDSVGETLTSSERLAYPSFMSDEEIIASKNRLKAFWEEAKKDANTREFLKADKGTYNSKAEMVSAMQRAMSEHLDDAETNAELFKHASYLANQHKGRKGWDGKSADIALPNGAKMSLSSVIGSAEKAHRTERSKNETKPESKRDTVVTEQSAEQPSVPNKTTKISASDLNSSRKTDATKTGNAEQKPSVSDSKVEKENAKRRAIEEAVASEKERIEPESRFTKEFKGNDLRTNQRKAYELLKGADEKTQEEIRGAFFKNSPTASTASFEAAKRGYLRPNARNPKHQAFAGSRVDLVGFDFNDNPVYKDQEVVYNDIKKSTAIEDKVTELLANPDLVEDITAFHKKAVDDAFNVKYLEGKRERVLTEALPHLKDSEGKPITDASKVTDGDLVSLAIDEEAKKGIDVKSLLGRFLKRLNALLSAIVAVVGVSAMTIPQDAHAQAGFATYESGPQIAGVSQEASNTINWVKATHDNNGKVFVVADKNEGKIHVVDSNGKVLDTQNAIFGRNKSNDNVANSTPSGRFKLQKALTTKASDKRVFGDDVLTLTDTVTGNNVTKKDGGVIAMHRLWNKPERVKAINSATASDNYMSAGCINVPTAFYNSAVDSLDGAMVYILDNKDAPKAGNTQKTDNATQKVAKSSTTIKPDFTKTTPTKQGKFGVSKVKFSTADFSALDTSLTKEKVKRTLDRVLGQHAKNVTVISRVDFNSVQASHYIFKNGIEGFYDDATGHVYIVADGIHAQNGLSAEDRVGFVAWHEMTHLGLDTKYGTDLRAILQTAASNDTIAKLAEKIQLERVNRGEAVSVNEDMAIEEALAELNAALKTDNVKALEDRYGVTIPEGLRSQTEKATDNLFTRIRNVIRKVLGKPVMTNQQVKDLFAGLDEAIAKHAAPESVAVTARLNEIAHDVKEGVNLDVDYSLRSAIDTIKDALNPHLEKVADKLSGNKHASKIADPAGFNPNSIDTTVTQKQKVKGDLSPRERLFEALADSQYSAIKYIGGYSTELAHKIKTTVNAVAHQQKQFQKKVFAFSDAMREAAKSRPDLYTRKNRQAIDTDVMVVTTALSAITKSTSALSSNEAIREKYQRMLDGFDYTDQQGNAKHKNGLREELAAYGYDPVNQQANIYTPYQMKKLNQMYAKVKEYEEILATFDKNKNVLLNEEGLSREDALKQRKNWRGHNGMTNADAYNAITKAVEQGKLDVTYDGKPWLDYINDVGFTKDKGFANTNKNYELRYDKLKVDGFLAPLVDTYVDTAKEFYKYQYDNLGSDITGQINENPFFTPTMGKASEIKTKSNMVGDTFYIDESRKIEERINDAMAAEWQGQQMGRAWTGSGTLNNLNALAALSAKRVGQSEVGKAIYNGGMNKKFNIRVVTTTDPNFGEAKGYLITRTNKNGDKQFVKVSLDNDRANEALFMDNVVTPNNALLDLARAMRSVQSIMITMMPAFSVYNAWRGFGEKRAQIKAFALNDKVGYFFSDLKDKSDGFRLQFAADLFKRSYANVFSGIMNRGYLRAAVAMALEEGDKSPTSSAFRNFLLKDPKVQVAYARLKDIAKSGGLSSRADSFQFSQEELQRAYEKEGLSGALSRKFAQAQTRMLTFTTAMEMVSTLATVDTLQDMGLSEAKAIEANLWFMNFNDKGASALSSILRSVVPFANATVQGARSTTRGLNTKAGWVNFFRQALFRVAWMGVGAMAMEMFPCEDEGDKESLRDYSPGELMRSTPFKIGCWGTVRLPIAYGSDMIAAAAGTALYQAAVGNWQPKAALSHVGHAISENVNVAPTPPGDANLLELITAPITPSYLKTVHHVMQDKDDFGNKLSRQGTDNLKEKWVAGKKTTADFWTLVAQGYDKAGLNLTPEQARYTFASFVPGVVDLIDAIDKPLQGKEKDNAVIVRTEKIARALTGWKTVHKAQQTPSQRTFVQVNNNLVNYKKINDEILVAAEQKELKFGAESANTQSWLKRKIEDGTFDKADEAKIKVILDYHKRQKRISSSSLSADKKNEKYYESNRRYLEEMHELEDR